MEYALDDPRNCFALDPETDRTRPNEEFGRDPTKPKFERPLAETPFMRRRLFQRQGAQLNQAEIHVRSRDLDQLPKVEKGEERA